MAERLIAAVLKTANGKPFKGSNPFPASKVVVTFIDNRKFVGGAVGLGDIESNEGKLFGAIADSGSIQNAQPNNAVPP